MNKSSRSAGDVASIKIQMNIHNSHICIEQVAIKFVSIKRQNERRKERIKYRLIVVKVPIHDLSIC